MKKNLLLSICLLLIGTANVVAAPPTAFTEGNLVVYRYGDGTAYAATVQVPTFLDEYTPAGTLVQSIPLPTTTVGNQRALTGLNNGIQEGVLTRSINGAYLTLLGIEAVAGSAPSSTTLPRVIGRVSYDGSINTATAFPYKVQKSATGIATVDGSKFWVAGARTASPYSGVMLFPFELNNGKAAATSETDFDTGTGIGGASTSLFSYIFNDLLYYSNSSSIRGFVSSSLPLTTTAADATPFNGFGTAATDPTSSQFLFFDTDNDGTPDLIYLANEKTTISGKIMKYSFIDDDNDTATPNKWINKGYVDITGVTNNMKFLTAKLDAGIVTIYCTTIGDTGSSTPSALYKVTNNVLNNLSNSDLQLTPTATAPANTTFRGVAFAPVATTNPVKLTSFTGKASSEGVRLTWVTSLERNNARFEVLRSTDNVNFSVIGTVNGNNNSDKVINYSFVDANPLAGTNYYQLNQIDYDAKSEKSAIIPVNYNGNSTVLSAYFSSNNQLDISISADQMKNAELYLTDVSGKVIVSEKIVLKTGLNSKTLNVKGVLPGVYVLNLVSEKERISIKLLK